MQVAVIGGGNWGRALSYAFSQKNNVGIVSRRKLKFLNAIATHKVTQISLKSALKCKYIIIAIKSEAMRTMLDKMRFLPESIVLIASKGIEVESGAFMSDVFDEVCAKNSAKHTNVGYLMGPSFASEVLEGMPCALTIHTKAQIADCAKIFPNFIKVYINDDVIGGEVAGAYKNIIAIAAGICDGLQLGNNAKASLIARGLVEMARFGEFFGAKESTFLGLSGAGDLFLTTNSFLSRNYRVGNALAKDLPLNNILDSLGEVAEGVFSTRAVMNLAKKHNIYTPIASQVYEILEGKNPRVSVKELLLREFDDECQLDFLK
ncbi:NAD(P)H-dependent glycerol-3-phosphate dehydrogenase [Helicobacter sp. 23-1045]